MIKFTGLEIKPDKNWKTFLEFFPNKKSSELERRIIQNLEKLDKEYNIGLDTELYGRQIGEICDNMGIDKGLACLWLSGRFTESLGLALNELVLIGGGDCIECGGDTEFWDHGEVKCLNCKTVFEANTEPEQYYNPRG